jgi:hypothetical protein
MSHVAEHCRRGEPNIGYLGVLSRCHFSHNIVFQNVSRESRHKMTGLVPKILVRSYARRPEMAMVDFTYLRKLARTFDVMIEDWLRFWRKRSIGLSTFLL